MLKKIKEKMEEEKKLDEMSLKEKIDLIAKAAKVEEMLKKEKKEKKIKFFPKLSRNQLKKNYAIILFLRTNGYIDLMKLPIEDGFVYVPKVDMRYSVSAESVLRWKNFPVVIIQEWSLEPISPSMLQRKTFEDKMKAYPQKILIDAIKKGQLQPKKSIGNILLWIILIIVAIFIIASLFGKKII